MALYNSAETSEVEKKVIRIWVRSMLIPMAVHMAIYLDIPFILCEENIR